MDKDNPHPPLPPPLPPVADLEDFGSVEVTNRCCGAMTCRVLAPDIFLEAKQGSGPSDGRMPDSSTPTDNFTYVGREIKNEDELRQVRRAVKACPFHALRMRRGTKGTEVMREDVNDAYPLPVGPHGEVYLLGHYTSKNAGASCYLIVRPKGGNVLIDATSPDASLVERIKNLGEVSYMVFTHKDHTAFHHEWFQALPGVQRVMHVDDVVEERRHFFFPYTGEVEIKVGAFPWNENVEGWTGMLNRAAVLVRDEMLPKQRQKEVLQQKRILTLHHNHHTCKHIPNTNTHLTAGNKIQSLDKEGDVLLIPIPGHTPGSLAILYRDHYLFTGDSLHYSRPRGHLISSRLHCWSSWEQQKKSLKTLEEYKWLHILPGHGDPKEFESLKKGKMSLRQALVWMEEQPGGYTSMGRFLPWLQLKTNNSGLLRKVPRWARKGIEWVVAPVGAPGTRDRARVGEWMRKALLVWFVLKVLPQVLAWWGRLRDRRRIEARASALCRLPWGHPGLWIKGLERGVKK